MCKCAKNRRTAKDLFLNIVWKGDRTTLIGFKTGKNYGTVDQGDVLRIYRFDFDPSKMEIQT